MKKNYKQPSLTASLVGIFSVFAIHSVSPFNKLAGKIVAASCGFGMHGSADEFSTCTTQINCNGVVINKTGRSQCGGVCAPTDTSCPSCPNGAVNSPSCNQCPSGLFFVNNVCVQGCSNGAINPTQCNICPSGSNMTNNQCVCNNGASIQSNCSACPSGQNMINGVCGTGCSVVNACNQTVQGVVRNGVCSVNANSPEVNNSCIQTFNITSSSIQPGGNTEFSWNFPAMPGVGRNCGFVDLSTPNSPRPIPGLQNLDAATDKLRINNIQRTTRFCLVCKFYDIKTNQSRGEASAHQWVRVIRVGEN
jgi:hypothetical protein